MNNPKADRRSARTRQLLREALMALMLEKRYDRITVHEIIDRANVGRSTFYMHYQDKQDLLLSSFEQLFVVLGHPSVATDGRPILPAVELFRHVKSQHRLYEALVWGRSVDLVFKAGQKYLSQTVEAHLAANLPAERRPAIPLAVVSNYLAGALLTLLRWWLDNQMPYSPEQMDEIFRQLAVPGVTALLIK
jgi:AcrR family transcriptional regulator